MKQFYYGSAAINGRAYQTLIPVNSLAFRIFGFTAEAWVELSKDFFSQWRWVSFPERIKSRGLPESFLQAWPLASDGLLLWQVFFKYVKDYLRLFYASDAVLLKDDEVALFWAHFEKYVPWQLPNLSLDALATLLTDIMFQVTGGHELLGSIVEYLTTPTGLPSKLLPGRCDPDVQTFAQSLILISLTGTRQPALMEEWGHLFRVASWTPAKQQAVLDLVRSLQVDLSTCADTIDHRNMLRERSGERQFVCFNPRILETSVSI